MYMLVEMNLTIRNIQASIKRIESVSAGTKELPAQAESLEDLHSVEEGLRTVQDREDMVRLNGSLISVLKQGHSWVLITSRFFAYFDEIFLHIVQPLKSFNEIFSKQLREIP